MVDDLSKALISPRGGYEYICKAYISKKAGSDTFPYNIEIVFVAYKCSISLKEKEEKKEKERKQREEDSQRERIEEDIKRKEAAIKRRIELQEEQALLKKKQEDEKINKEKAYLDKLKEIKSFVGEFIEGQTEIYHKVYGKGFFMSFDPSNEYINVFFDKKGITKFSYPVNHRADSTNTSRVNPLLWLVYVFDIQYIITKNL